MKPCNCKHMGHCPFEGQPDARRTDLEGKPLWRELLDGESTAQQPGDLALALPDGDVASAARAIDPDHVLAYAKSKAGTRCKGQRLLWRMKNKVPS